MQTLPKEFQSLELEDYKNKKEQIEELLDLNEGLRIQTEALKDAFQIEVKKINSESQEIKKSNKELKDSLFKLTSKCETQNKTINEIASLIFSGSGDSLAIIKNFVISRLESPESKETNLESSFAVSQLKKENDYCNDKLKKISFVIYELEKYTGQQSVQILEYLKNKEGKYKIIFEEVKQVIDKNIRQFMASFNVLAIEKMGKIRKCADKLFLLKSSLNLQRTESLNELRLKDKILDQMNAGCFKQEISFCANKNEPTIEEKNFEDFETLKSHYEECIEMLKIISKLDMDITDFTGYKIKIDELLESRQNV